MERLQYNNKALVGNWYEDRLDPSRAPIPELERTGKYRVTPLKMIETTPDLYVTTNQRMHAPQVPLVAPPPVRFISKEHMALALHQHQLPAGTPTSGFGSILPSHDSEHDKRRFETTTHSVFGGKYADKEDKRVRDEDFATTTQSLQEKAAGRVLSAEGRVGIRTGGATDERLQLGETDPKSHSLVQRSWLGHDGHVRRALAGPPPPPEKNLPGLALKGLGESGARVMDPDRKFYKKNDTIRRDLGIWNE